MSNKGTLVVLLALLMHVPALAQQNGVTLVGHIDQRHGGPGPAFGFYYASCWGYVSPDGREYALIATYTGTSIIDITTDSLREVAFIGGPPNEWREIKTWGHYAYVVSEASGSGLQIINLRQLPDTAWLVRTVTNVGGRSISRNHTITVADGYLYLNGTNGAGGSVILSLQNPENPTLAGEYSPTYFHDVYVRNDTLFAAAIYAGGGVYVVDVSNKASPILLRRIIYANSGTHNTWASIDGRYVFTTDEISHPRKNLKVWDLDSLGTAPHTPVAEYTATGISPLEIIHNVHGRGHYAYIAYYTAGVRVVDVHNPRAPVEAGAYDTYPGVPPSPAYDGVWGVYPYFPSGKWIASDTQTGLYVFRFSGLAPRIRSSLISPADADTVGLTGSITFRWAAAANQQADPHYYEVRLSGGTVDTLLRTNDTLLTLTDLSWLTDGENYSWHVWIRDEFTRVSSQDTFAFTYRAAQVGVEETDWRPRVFVLHQNYPNPFNPITKISYSLTASGRVSLVTYDYLGRLVKVLVDEHQQAGIYDVPFDATTLPSGVYFYRLRFGDLTETKKMLLLK